MMTITGHAGSAGRAAVVLALVTLSAGCSGATAASSDSPPAAQTAIRFAAAAPDSACDLLAPQTRRAVEDETGESCADALPTYDLPTYDLPTYDPRTDDPRTDDLPGGAPVTSEIAGRSAQVRLTDQVIFLAEFAQGWRVTAAGCRRTDPDPQIPYHCEVAP